MSLRSSVEEVSDYLEETSKINLKERVVLVLKEEQDAVTNLFRITLLQELLE